jgi:hypothetical protein
LKTYDPCHLTLAPSKSPSAAIVSRYVNTFPLNRFFMPLAPASLPSYHFMGFLPSLRARSLALLEAYDPCHLTLAPSKSPSAAIVNRYANILPLKSFFIVLPPLLSSRFSFRFSLGSWAETPESYEKLLRRSI